MPLNAIQQWLASDEVLNGLQSPQYAPLNAVVTSHIQSPDVLDLVDTGGIMRPVPFAFVWVNNGHEDRQTMPRGQAWKKIKWRVQVVLQVVENPDDPLRATAFPLLIDQIRAFLGNPATLSMPIIISDPVTGAQSQVLNVGEEIDYEVFIPDMIGAGGQALVRPAARLNLLIEEAVQGEGIGLPA